MTGETANSRAIVALLFYNFAYAVNSYSIASVFPSIPLEVSGGISGLGVVTAAYYLANALLLVPGGLLAAKMGSKSAIVYGAVLYSVAALLTSLSEALYQITVLRFVVGVGMAIVLGPGYSLIVKYYRRGSEGLAIGLANAGFGIGGAVGLFAWAILANSVGWRLALASSGLVGLASAVILFLSVPVDDSQERFSFKIRDLQALILDRRLITYGLVLVGLTIGDGLFGYFVVYYLEESLGVSPGIAGFVGGLWLLFLILSAPLSGRVYDRVRDVKKPTIAAMAILSVGLVLPIIGSIYATLVAAAVIGLSSGAVYTILLSVTREIYRTREGYESTAVNWVNSLAYGGFWAPVLFSYVITARGFSGAWPVGGLLTFVWITPLVFLKSVRRSENSSVRSS